MVSCKRTAKEVLFEWPQHTKNFVHTITLELHVFIIGSVREKVKELSGTKSMFAIHSPGKIIHVYEQVTILIHIQQ